MMQDRSLADVARTPIAGCAALIVAAIVVAGFGNPDTYKPRIETAAIAESVGLYFTDNADGSVTASDAATGAALGRIEPGVGGFVRTMMRGIVSDRLKRGIGPQTPFQLARMDKGDLMLSDPETGRVVALDAFGQSNAGAFAQFLEHRSNGQ